MEFNVGLQCGCLTIIDMGEDYTKTELYINYVNRKNELMHENDMLQSIDTKEKKIQILEQQHSAFSLLDSQSNSVNIDKKFQEFKNHRIFFNNEELKRIEPKLLTHYKCKCKCGKVCYYDEETLQNSPKYCFYPIPISTKYTYSVKAQNATYNKRKKYSNLENVKLCDKSECFPSEEYCERYNTYKIKQLQKQEINLQNIISNIPRKNAPNYENDYTGMQYESLFVEKCIDEHFESKPSFHFSQSHNKCWETINVYKVYKCRCNLCGKVQEVTCDKFGIFPPTEYGYNAYNGYWSNLKCDCHKISSFQWIVNKILIDNSINYQVEYSFPDLYGTYGLNNLRFDFAIFDESGNLKCLIECQGEQHYKAIDEFGGEKGLETQVENDNLKREYIAKNNIRLIEISYKKKQIDSVKQILKSNGII